MFRGDLVHDATTQVQQPQALQRLVRWTSQHPSEVFLRGFEPRYTTNDVTNHAAFNLEQYVSLASSDTPRVFVSTKYPIRLPNGKVYAQRPLSFKEFEFAYDIYAYGGIDVDHAIPGNQFAAEMEVAFPGGIHWESVRLARQYLNNRLVAVWWNARFDASVIAGLPAPTVPPFIVEYYYDPTTP